MDDVFVQQGMVLAIWAMFYAINSTLVLPRFPWGAIGASAGFAWSFVIATSPVVRIVDAVMIASTVHLVWLWRIHPHRSRFERDVELERQRLHRLIGGGDGSGRG